MHHPLFDAAYMFDASSHACCVAVQLWVVQNLPSDMALSHALDSGLFEMMWLPKEPVGAPTMDMA